MKVVFSLLVKNDWRLDVRGLPRFEKVLILARV